MSEKSALLLIDIQQSFEALPERWKTRDNPAFESNNTRLVDAFRKAGQPVVFVMHTDDDETFRESSPHFKLMRFLERRPDEPLFIKRTRNAFTSTALQPWLLERGIRKLCITGIQTEQCCETTARVGRDLGFEIDFVTDATLTFPISNPDKPGERLLPDAIRERTEYALRGRFARIRTTAQLVGELGG
jgi:nicotinamidase-related amidase